jgi:hypothetical protein
MDKFQKIKLIEKLESQEGTNYETYIKVIYLYNN